MLMCRPRFLASRPLSFQRIGKIVSLVTIAQTEFAGFGQTLVKGSLASIPGILTVMVYLILIPLLVFFFLKDRQQILDWLSGFLPPERPLLRRIWSEMNEQFANYARGKVLEVLVVGSITYFAFIFMGVNYAALLGLLVGLSVIVPYIGAMLVTLPVAIVGFFQWGLSSEFYYLFGVYVFIQVLDGNVLVPYLFSEAVNLHPVVIILAVLFFGGSVDTSCSESAGSDSMCLGLVKIKAIEGELRLCWILFHSSSMLRALNFP